MIRLILRIVGLTLLIGYLLIAGIVYGFWRTEPCYRGIKVVIDYPSDEAHFVTEESILQLIKAKPGFRCKGQRYTDVNTLELSQYIEQKNQLVRHAACFHTPDSLLRIDIEQRCPVMRVKSLTGVQAQDQKVLNDFFIDRDGALMPAIFGNAVQLPLATGYVKAEHIEPLRNFARFLTKDDFWGDEVTQIYIRQDGDVELIPRVGDHTILLGTLDNVEQKLDHVLTFYEKVLPRRGWNTYRTINVKFNGQVLGEK